MTIHSPSSGRSRRKAHAGGAPAVEDLAPARNVHRHRHGSLEYVSADESPSSPPAMPPMDEAATARRAGTGLRLGAARIDPGSAGPYGICCIDVHARSRTDCLIATHGLVVHRRCWETESPRSSATATEVSRKSRGAAQACGQARSRARCPRCCRPVWEVFLMGCPGRWNENILSDESSIV